MSLFRYLKAAFWLNVDIPAIGRLPLNVLLLLGCGVLGIGEFLSTGEAGFLLLGLGCELLYLFTLIFNPRFQRWVNANDFVEKRDKSEQNFSDKLQNLIEQLHDFEEKRFRHLQKKIKRLNQATTEQNTEDFLSDEKNNATLRRLLWTYLKLLLAQQNLSDPENQEKQRKVQKQINDLQNDLNNPHLPQSVRMSKQETLEILKQRIQHFERRLNALHEINADLVRIEAEVDLALDKIDFADSHTLFSNQISLVSSVLQKEFYQEADSVLIAELDEVFQ